MREILRLCFVLTIISAVSAGVLAFVSQKTAGPIENALREEKMSAVRRVLPPFDNDPDQDTKTIDSGGEEFVFYLGMKEGAPVGAAFSVIAPNGYSGEIDIMVGVDTAGVVQGIEILRHLETPGLGSKIETEGFRSQYRGKSLGNPEVWDVVKDGGTFKQITGATISSRAVTHAVARGLEFFTEHRAEIFGPAGTHGLPDDSSAAAADTGATHPAAGDSADSASGSAATRAAGGSIRPAADSSAAAPAEGGAASSSDTGKKRTETREE
jgi:electron transport complex protein RnfG